MPSISGIATNHILTAVDIKIPDVSCLVKKQIMMIKQQTFRINTLLQLITINLLKTLSLMAQKVKN